MAGARDLIERLKDTGKESDSSKLGQTLMLIQRLTFVIEKELHTVVLDCARARRAAMKEGIHQPPIFH